MTKRNQPSPVAAGALILVLACALVATASCATARQSSSAFGRLPDSGSSIDLASIELESVYSYSESLDEIRAVILSRAARVGLALTDARTGSGINPGKDGRANPSISFFLRERHYAKGLKSLYSLAILAEIRDASGNVVLRADYFRDGDESFDSFSVLDESLGAVVGEVSLALNKAK